MAKENNLVRLRELRGMTQKEVAEELDITRQAVSQWEAGTAYPSMEKLIALSQLYNVPVEELYWSGRPEKPEDAAEPPPEPEDVAESAPEPEETAEPQPKPEDAAGTNWAEAKQSLRQRKRRIVVILMLCIFCGTFSWGQLTNSPMVAKAYLFWEIVFLIAGYTIKKFIWRNKKK